MLRSTWIRGLLRQAACVALLATATCASAAAADCSAGSFPSTFALIQKAIFENHGCTSSVCHGSDVAGGLDLRAEHAYENLVDVDASSVPGFKRVLAGVKDQSLLWLNLAAKTLPNQYKAPIRPMPLDPIPALSADELEAVHLWIEKGAPKNGVIPGTDTLLDACLPPPEPLEIKPLPPPAAGTGVQLRMPRWTLSANHEREVCLASYYDITDQVPPEFRSGPGGTTFRYKRNQIRQTPLSHHLIVNLYTGEIPPNDTTVWGEYYCQGGQKDRQTCNPLEIGFCGDDAQCATDPVTTIGCIGFGPGDAGLGVNSAGFTGTQQTASEFRFAEGVYAEVPLKGLILWDSHSFNLTNKDGTLEAYLNFDFAAPAEQLTPARGIFDASNIFKTNAPAFATDEVCNIHEMPPNARLYELSSHAHQRMKRWRTFLGAFRCQGGPSNGAACEPFGSDFVSPDLCAGAPCKSMVRPHVGDCNLDDSVTVDEVLESVNIALGTDPIEACHEADTNGDEAVSVDELLTGVNAVLSGVPAPTERDPHESLLYVSLVYSDPLLMRLDPPMVFPGAGSAPADRSLTYCALYDNGFTKSEEVKKRSTSPRPPLSIPGIGGPCLVATHCTAGKVREPCHGNGDAARNASCDSPSGAGNGVCDACPLRGGVTTEDEMFLFLGQYFVP